jgi:hypothetical protein
MAAQAAIHAFRWKASVSPMSHEKTNGYNWYQRAYSRTATLNCACQADLNLQSSVDKYNFNL